MQLKNLKMIMTYNVRFAPSPSGFLHVGGARTALFNWLLAKKSGGNFYVRIEDTNRERSSEQSVIHILNSLRWLELDWDGEIVYQSRNLERHKKIAGDLLESGKAYRCFCSKEALQEKRDFAQRNKRNKYYDETCRRLSAEQIDDNLRQNLPYSIRFKVDEQAINFEDAVRGKIRVHSSTLDDFIIVRPDGNPVYQLAVVVDDHDTGVNFILRGEDHLSNTPKQILLYHALNWPLPGFAHVPLILGNDKKRLSKRHGATSVEEFRDQGILAQTLFNYLSLLGWSSKTEEEVFSREELVEQFNLNNINKNAAVFDFKKMLWFNHKHIAAIPANDIYKYVENWLEEEKLILENEEKERFKEFCQLQQSRSATLLELTDTLKIFFSDPKAYDPKGVHKFFVKQNGQMLLDKLQSPLELLDDAVFNDTQELESVIRQFAKNNGVSAAKVIHPLRLALSGRAESIGIFDLLKILGKSRVLTRLRNIQLFLRDVK